MASKNKLFFLQVLALTILALTTTAGCSFFNSGQPATVKGEADQSYAIIKVTVTSQGWYFHRPWQNRRPVTRQAIGAVVQGGLVLVTANLVANQRYIELERLDRHGQCAGSVQVVDYEANLALIRPADPRFLSGLPPMELAANIRPRSVLTILQVKPNGDVVPSRGTITSVDLAPYPFGDFFLTYRLNQSLQYRYANQTLPVLASGKLAGFVMRYSSKSQTVEVLAAPVIRHFMADAATSPYNGFPRAGFRYSPLLDPQLRHYLKLPENIEGIYIQSVLKGSPAEKAGLKDGDVLVQVGNNRISPTGHFKHPLYGKTKISHLIRSTYFVGDRVSFIIYRQGKRKKLEVILNHRKPDQYLVPPYIVGRPPNYVIIAGLIFQELSVPYLREYGSDWKKRAPVDLLYYTQNQDYLARDEKRPKIVILSGVIPTALTIGYENLRNLVVSKINGKAIGSVKDVVAAMAAPKGKYCKLEFEKHPHVIYLDPGEIPVIDKLVREKYRISPLAAY